MVNNDQTREDVSTTTSDGDVNPGWLKVCMKRSKKTIRTDAQATLDLNAVHSIDEEKMTITMGSGAAVSAMHRDMLPKVPERGGPENKFYWTSQEGHVQFEENGSTQSMNFRLADVTKALAAVEEHLPVEERSRV